MRGRASLWRRSVRSAGKNVVDKCHGWVYNENYSAVGFLVFVLCVMYNHAYKI